MASSLCSSHTGGNVPPPRPPHGTPRARNPARSKPPLDGDLRHERMLSPRPRHPRPTWCGRKPAGQLASFGSSTRWDAGPPSRSLGSPPAGNGEKQLVALTGPWGGRRGPHTRGGRSPVPAGPAGRGVGEGRTRRPSSGPWGKRLHSRFLGDPWRPRAESFGGSAESSPAPPRCRGQDRDEAHEVCALGAERDKNTGPEIREDSWQAARWPPLPGGPLPGHRGRETLSG